MLGMPLSRLVAVIALQLMSMIIVVLAQLLSLDSANAESATALTSRSDEAVKVFRDCPTCPEMAVLATGEFLMGTVSAETRREGVPEQFANWEQPQHVVTVKKPFAKGKYHVTRGEYAAFIDETKHQATGCFVLQNGTFVEDKSKSWKNPGYPQTDRDPVVCVSWNDAKAYVLWLSRKTKKTYRLATESEWEYAARGGTTTSRWWGEDINVGCTHANIADISVKKAFVGQNVSIAQCNDGYTFTSPVGHFAPNPFGLYDMLGNVWQLIQDCWYDDYLQPPRMHLYTEARTIVHRRRCVGLLGS
jgi:sulfatase modifying factor 1